MTCGALQSIGKVSRFLRSESDDETIKQAQVHSISGSSGLDTDEPPTNGSEGFLNVDAGTSFGGDHLVLPRCTNRAVHRLISPPYDYLARPLGPTRAASLIAQLNRLDRGPGEQLAHLGHVVQREDEAALKPL